MPTPFGIDPELLKVIAVIDSVVAGGMAEAPEFTNNVSHELPL